MLMVIAFFIFIAIVTSGGEDKPTTPTTDADGQTIAAAATTDKNILQGSGTLGDYQVEIVTARRETTEFLNEELLLVTYKWTNNSNDAKSFGVALDDIAYQDGVQCTWTISGDREVNLEHADLKPGATMELTIAYTLVNTTSPVEIEVARTFSSTPKVVKTFVIA